MWQKVTTEKALVRDKDGKLVIKEITSGHYRFIETKAPEGYLINTEPIKFNVVTNKDGQTPEIKVDPFINYLGSAILVKKDGETNKELSGTSFKIKKVKDSFGKPTNEEINRNFVSNAAVLVEVTNLAPGEYEVREVKAPTVYLLNKEKIKFTVTDKALGKPANIDVGNF